MNTRSLSAFAGVLQRKMQKEKNAERDPVLGPSRKKTPLFLCWIPLLNRGVPGILCPRDPVLVEKRRLFARGIPTQDPSLPSLCKTPAHAERDPMFNSSEWYFFAEIEALLRQ